MQALKDITGKLRLFIAVTLPNDLKKDLKRLAHHEIRGVRWTQIDKLHITLHFLGSTKASKIPKLMEELSQIRVECFTLKLNDCGFFPGYEHPKVFWMGLEDSLALHQLHTEVKDVLDGLGVETEKRPFKPHLTLGRIGKDYRSRRSNAHVFELAEPFMDRMFEVDAFHLFYSEQSSAGSKYTCIHSVPCFNA